MEVDMNPDLISIQKNRQYILYNENQHHFHQKKQSYQKASFKNPKIEHYLKVLDDSGIHRSVIEHMSVFFVYLTRRNRRIGTILMYYNAIKRLMLFLKPLNIKRIEMVRRDDLGAFIEFLQDSHLKPSTINSYLTNLYVVFGFLIEQNVINPDLMRHKFRLRMPDELPKAIDPNDIRQLISAIDTTRERALILILLRTGMRIGELLATKIEDIDLTERKIQIPQASKNYEGRIVFFSDDACKALKTWLQNSLPGNDYIFYGCENHKKLSYPRARQLFIKCTKKAGLSHKGYTLHCLRHTFASELLNAGMRLECLQVLLGHRNIEVTRRYARLTDKTRKEEYFKAIEKIERGDINGYYRFHN